MKEKGQKTIHIKWIRSGIAFPRHQKTMVKSLGLGRLNQVVERPDTPQIRGLVECMPHLVKVVRPPEKPAWMAVPEYTILPPDPLAAPAPRPAKAVREKPEKPAAELEERAETVAAGTKPEKAAGRAEHASKAKKTAKAAAKKAKADKASEAKKSKAAKVKPAKKTKR